MLKIVEDTRHAIDQACNSRTAVRVHIIFEMSPISSTRLLTSVALRPNANTTERADERSQVELSAAGSVYLANGSQPVALCQRDYSDHSLVRHARRHTLSNC